MCIAKTDKLGCADHSERIACLLARRVLYEDSAVNCKANESTVKRRIPQPVLPRARVVPRPLTDLDPETAKLIEDVTYDSKGRAVPKLFSKTWANAELRKMLNIGGQKEREQTDLSRLSDAELIQRLADQAKN